MGQVVTLVAGQVVTILIFNNFPNSASRIIKDIPSIVKDFLPRAVSPVNIQNSSKITGIYPFNRNIFQDDDFLSCYTTDRTNTVVQSLLQTSVPTTSRVESPLPSTVPNTSRVESIATSNLCDCHHCSLVVTHDLCVHHFWS